MKIITRTTRALQPQIRWLVIVLAIWSVLLAVTLGQRAIHRHNAIDALMALCEAAAGVLMALSVRTAWRFSKAAAAGREIRHARAALESMNHEYQEVRELHEAATAALIEHDRLLDSLGSQFPFIRLDNWLRTAGRRGIATALTRAAVLVAGRRHQTRARAWHAHLVGLPEEGLPVSPTARMLHAAGFVVAALRLRGHDLFGGLWAPVDWVLARRSRSEALVALAAGAEAVYVTVTGGLHALLTDGLGWCAGAGGATYALLRWLRRIRGIELASQEPRSGE